MWHNVLSQFAADPQAIQNYQALKYSPTVEVFRGRLTWPDGGLDIIAKLHRPGGASLQRWGGQIATLLRGTRARRNLHRTCALLAAGVNTARPVAIVESSGKTPHSIFVTEFLDGLVDLDQIVLSLLPRLDTTRRHGIKKALIECVANLFARLHRSGWRHRDLKASNILLKNWNGAGGPPTAWLVDLDGLRRRLPWEPLIDRAALIRLVASLWGYQSATRTDLARFLERYLRAVGGPDATWRELFRAIVAGARAYQQRSARRKHGKLDVYGTAPR